MRKERVIKAGYTPQEEQPVYTTRNVLAQRNAPIIPGVDNNEVLALQKAAATKKEKKETSCSEPKEKQAEKPAKQKVATEAPPAPPPAPAPQEEDSEKVKVEKEIRKVKKKMREVDHLVEKQDKGETLAQAETDKLSKLSTWKLDLERLEKELAAL